MGLEEEAREQYQRAGRLDEYDMHSVRKLLVRCGTLGEDETEDPFGEEPDQRAPMM
jgi:hypothetical protein